MALSYGRAGRLTAENGGFRPRAESANTPGLFFAGTLAHQRDWRKVRAGCAPAGSVRCNRWQLAMHPPAGQLGAS